jgi:hypothetical protein
MVRLALDGRVSARRVRVRRCEVIAADGSTGGLGSLCCSLWRADQARQTSVRRVVAGSGSVRRCEVIVADGSTELRKRLPAALFGK